MLRACTDQAQDPPGHLGPALARAEHLARPRLLVWLFILVLLAFASRSHAQYAELDESEEESTEDESSVTVNGMMRMQGGLFVPLISNRFSPDSNTAEVRTATSAAPKPCDVIAQPLIPCYPTNHGKAAGSPSITRATLQIEANWDFTRWLTLHTIIRGTRSMQLPADAYAQVPTQLNKLPDETSEHLSERRAAYSKRWVRDNEYNTFELRELYADITATDWLSFRLGRQQVAWGETAGHILDVVNPMNTTWHFSALEQTQNQRVPLWMALTNIDIDRLKGGLELVYIPGVDRARDTVTTPLSNAGAWGIPYSSAPSPFRVAYKDFRYPGGHLDPDFMRYAARWHGDLGDHMSYSLMYMYTHMMIPVLQDVHNHQTGDGSFDTANADSATLLYPRQHIMGGSLEYAVPSPLGLTIRFETSYQPNHTFSNNVVSGGKLDPATGINTFNPRTKKILTYAIMLQRPTMIRWLNPVQSFFLVAQFQHTHTFNVNDVQDFDLVQVVGFNDWRIPSNSYQVVAQGSTSYLHGVVTPKLTFAAIITPDYKDDNPDKTSLGYKYNQHITSGLVSFDVAFRIGPHYRLNVTVTDFFGGNPYRDLGLFRDRDEVALSGTVLF